MNNKLYLLIALSILNGALHASDLDVQSVLRNKTEHGDTPLHLAVLPHEQIDSLYPKLGAKLKEQDRVDANYDKRNANVAANLIWLRADVSIKSDRNGLTPLAIAEQNKGRFPTIYEVLMAGKAIQDALPHQAPAQTIIDKYSSKFYNKNEQKSSSQDEE